MDIRQITENFYVSPQIDCDDMAALREAGITMILCNRPDEEVHPSICAEAMAAAAEAAGLKFAVVPLTHQSMVPEVIAQNRALGPDSGEVVLAYCASGTRSTIAWALGQAGRMEGDEIVAAGASGGYDLRNIRHVLDTPFCSDS